jgi:hypothetical protein
MVLSSFVGGEVALRFTRITHSPTVVGGNHAFAACESGLGLFRDFWLRGAAGASFVAIFLSRQPTLMSVWLMRHSRLEEREEDLVAQRAFELSRKQSAKPASRSRQKNLRFSRSPKKRAAIFLTDVTRRCLERTWAAKVEHGFIR